LQFYGYPLLMVTQPLDRLTQWMDYVPRTNDWCAPVGIASGEFRYQMMIQ
jgi:hypothetical protein